MGLTHLDVGVVIGFLDANDARHPAARDSFGAAIGRGDQFALSGFALTECLVGPARRGDAEVQTVLTILDRISISIVDLDEVVAVRAALLRAQHPVLKLPDAFVIASAATTGADLLVTTDRGWPPATQLGIDTVIEIL